MHATRIIDHLISIQLNVSFRLKDVISIKMISAFRVLMDKDCRTLLQEFVSKGYKTVKLWLKVIAQNAFQVFINLRTIATKYQLLTTAKNIIQFKPTKTKTGL